MHADDPYALFITWTTYGTWLPGDERGHVSDRPVPHEEGRPKQNRPGTEYAKGNAYTRELAQARQKWPTVWLTRQQAVTVAQSLVAAASARGWFILRAAIMTNHVHVFVTRCPIDGPVVRRALKGVCQAELNRENVLPRRWWTQRGSDRLRRGERAIEDTTRYVAEQPGMLVEIVEMQVVKSEP